VHTISITATQLYPPRPPPHGYDDTQRASFCGATFLGFFLAGTFHSFGVDDSCSRPSVVQSLYTKANKHTWLLELATGLEEPSVVEKYVNCPVARLSGYALCDALYMPLKSLVNVFTSTATMRSRSPDMSAASLRNVRKKDCSRATGTVTFLVCTAPSARGSQSLCSRNVSDHGHEQTHAQSTRGGELVS
jgi:hypothetical protein